MAEKVRHLSLARVGARVVSPTPSAPPAPHLAPSAERSLPPCGALTHTPSYALPFLQQNFALKPYLDAIKATLHASLCIENFASRIVERHNKPEIEVG